MVLTDIWIQLGLGGSQNGSGRGPRLMDWKYWFEAWGEYEVVMYSHHHDEQSFIFSVEEMYQAFKARLEAEVMAEAGQDDLPEDQDK